jgi:hypothetical protein
VVTRDGAASDECRVSVELFHMVLQWCDNYVTVMLCCLTVMLYHVREYTFRQLILSIQSSTP